MMKFVLTATAFMIAALAQPQKCAADDTIIDVIPLTENADWDVAPDGSGFVVSSTNGAPAEFLVAIASLSGITTANVTVSSDGSYIDAVGDSGYQPAAPLVLEAGSQVAYVMALTNSGNANATTSSFASRSWLDNYSNWFNSTFGSGWSEAAGGVIHDGLTTVIDESTLASTSDGALLTGTTIVSIPAGIAIVAGGELVLGVGTLGTTATTATAVTGTSVAGVTVVEGAVGTTTVIATAEGAGIGATTILVGIEGAEVATATTTIAGLTGTEAVIGSTVTATGIGIGIPASTELAVVGSLEYTMPYLGVGGYNVLYTSNAAWTMGMNYTWLEAIVASGESVLLYPGAGVTALEVQYLLEHWYIRVGNLLTPGF